MSVGKSIKRVDAYEKVTGGAKYTDDLCPRNALVAKVLHSTIANGVVKSIDTSKAEKLAGVEKIVTCFDVPDILFPTAGHPWSTQASHQDIADRKLLNKRVRFYGDDIAVVIADNEVNANRALKLIKVEYEEYEPVLDVFKAMENGATTIHPEISKSNILAHSDYELGNYNNAVKEKGLLFFEGEYETQVVQHCHIEPPISYSYMENDRIVVVSSTQIPHIVRRVVGQALGISWGKVRVIKPYIGGGFGNKQDILYEPLNAYLTTQVGGRCVKLEISREETFSSTRVRHSIKFKMKTAVRKDGTFVARKVEAYSNQGAYASHGHSIVANAITCFRQLYSAEKSVKGDAYTVYTNQSSAGAMRGYGIPQAIFALESHIDDIAKGLNMDPGELRIKNCMKNGFKDPLNGIECHTDAIEKCIIRGKEYINWDNKINKYKNQTGNIRRGIGMSIFSYKTGVYPISLETASCRIALNQDASVQVQMGATEIGQGADTVFTQMVAEVLDIKHENVHIVSYQDTDVTPFDPGAYASRQTYVSGTAAKNAALKLKDKILDYACFMLKTEKDKIDLKKGNIIDKKTGKPLLPLENLAVESFYNLENSQHLTAEVTNHCTNNTFSVGACFAEVEVDMALGKVKVIDIIDIHDSGAIINPKLAEAQVHGGMSMGLGFALSENLIYNEKGKPLNNNLLDYKLPTSMDTPDLHCEFIEVYDPTGPFGNKSLGEPPAIPQAPAIRNAILCATGVKFNSTPFNPQKLYEKFKEANLI